MSVILWCYIMLCLQYKRYSFSEVVLRWHSNSKHDCVMLFVHTIWLMNGNVLLLSIQFEMSSAQDSLKVLVGRAYLNTMNQGHVNMTAFVAITFFYLIKIAIIVLKLQLSKTFKLFVRKDQFNFLSFIWQCILLWFLLSYMYRTSVIAVPCPNCILYHAY